MDVAANSRRPALLLSKDPE